MEFPVFGIMWSVVGRFRCKEDMYCAQKGSASVFNL